ncbi:transglycosylase SLT domain-containing protein [Lentisphaerota bacterium ZTH]|nr:transglycosylase SLT domain-containing protein [Lentisphaerota bacterium]WET06206.1 transglycosylase SLT domain-containing protein [Lentisphaerota bacterium ZTH]
MFVAMLLTGAAVSVAVYHEEIRDSFVDQNKYHRQIARTAAKYGVDSRLIKALIFRESRFDPNARGRFGEIGLMQIIPASAVEDWARYHGVKTPAPGLLYSPSLNIEIGTWYLAKALTRWRRYRHGIELALCQYNAGESRAVKWKPKTYEAPVLDNITIQSTRSYVETIMKKYREFCENSTLNKGLNNDKK